MKTESEIKVQKVVVTVKGKQLDLTVEEAKRLRDELLTTFPIPIFTPIVVTSIPTITISPPSPFVPIWNPICGTIS